MTEERVDGPAHYGGKDNPFEAIKIIEDWGLGFCAGNAVKYILRAKHKGDEQLDLRKAHWYLCRAAVRKVEKFGRVGALEPDRVAEAHGISGLRRNALDAIFWWNFGNAAALIAQELEQ